MQFRIRFLAALSVAVIIAVSAFFLPRGADDGEAQAVLSQFGENGSCENEAVLLSKSSDVRADPEGDAGKTLEAGHPVYLCGKTGEYRRVVFPERGSPADCSLRKTKPCASGYIKVPVEFNYAG